jgi:Tol biopolymer transport system component
MLLVVSMLAAAFFASASCSSSSVDKSRTAEGGKTSARLAYVTVESTTGDLSSVDSRLYIATPSDKLTPQAVRDYPGQTYYEMLASPDGQALAVTAGGIMVILDLQGEELMRLDTPAVSFSGAGPFASWSADSTVFAYTRVDYGTGVPSDSANARPSGTPPGWIETVDIPKRTVTTPPKLKNAPLTQPAFAPTGGRFAAISANESRGDARSIAIVDETGDYHQLTDQPQGNMATPVWSPDGRWIAYWLPNGVDGADGRRLSEEAIYVVAATGGSPRQIGEAGFLSAQAWSPDGKTLALTCAERSNDQSPKIIGSNVCVADAAGGAPSKLTDDGTSFDAAFAPDGASIAYLTDRDKTTGTFTLKVVRLDTRETKTVASFVPFGGFSWLAGT